MKRQPENMSVLVREFISQTTGDFWNAAAAVGVVVLYVAVEKIHRCIKKRSTRKFYKKQTEKKRRELASQIEALEKKLEVDGVLLTYERIYILDLPPTSLLQELKEGKLTAVNVLHAFQAKAIEVTRRLNCITEFVHEAETYAKILDDMPDRNLPLHGLPISIKEEFAMKNYDSVFGIAKFIDKPSTKDAVMVTALKRIGAVPFCRTNVPQILFSYGSMNPIFGLTRHPTHLDRTPGGSSSGEGALIGGGGSILGMGSDIGGSLRIPSHFCGIVTLKPTSQRLSTIGELDIIPGVQGIKLSPGIMGKDVDIVTTAYKGLFDNYLMNEIDALSLPLKWRSDLYDIQRPLRIGVMCDFPIVPATPGCARAVTLSVEAFSNAGHTVVPFEMTSEDILSVFRCVGRLAMADNCQSIAKLLENEELSQSAAEAFYMAAKIPESIRNCMDVVMRFLGVAPNMATRGATKSVDLMNLVHERSQFIREIVDRWSAANIDVWLVPAYPFPAPLPEYLSQIGDAFIYTLLFNYLDFPAGVVPVTFENAGDQLALKEYNHRGNRLTKYIEKVTRGGEGLPIGVQIVGLPWKEEIVLRAMKELQDALRII